MPASNDDTHQEIRDDTGYSHHQALNCRNAGIKGWYKEQIARESWIEVNREVADGDTDSSVGFSLVRLMSCGGLDLRDILQHVTPRGKVRITLRRTFSMF
ncbi:hypothetical protein FXO37_06659 [Capsicum annuum]|nr:hypothetical protein FXO37_06659 [Capsicum annuum]